MNDNEIEYFQEKSVIDYPYSIKFMEKKVEEIYKNNCKEFLWFLEHDNIYTAGTSAKPEGLRNSSTETRHTNEEKRDRVMERVRDKAKSFL